MARPLPNTNAPASAKYQKTFHNVAPDAGPCSPVSSQGGSGASARAPARPSRPGGALTSSATTPEATNTQTISDSVQAVTTALTPNRAASSQSLPTVMRTSLQALRAMMAMTAAPTP